MDDVIVKELQFSCIYDDFDNSPPLSLPIGPILVSLGLLASVNLLRIASASCQFSRRRFLEYNGTHTNIYVH